MYIRVCVYVCVCVCVCLCVTVVSILRPNYTSESKSDVTDEFTMPVSGIFTPDIFCIKVTVKWLWDKDKLLTNLQKFYKSNLIKEEFIFKASRQADVKKSGVYYREYDFRSCAPDHNRNKKISTEW